MSEAAARQAPSATRAQFGARAVVLAAFAVGGSTADERVLRETA
jgi:hypothetical protein